MKKIRTLLQIAIGILIIAFILRKLNINEVTSVLRETDVFYFILACLSYFFLNMVLATRLRFLLKRIGYRIRFSTVLLSHMGGMLVGDITPGRSGYFLTPPILKKITGAKITDGMACIFAPQGIEFILKVGGAAAAILYISTLGMSSDLLVSAVLGAVILLAVGILMLVVSWHEENISSRFIRKLPYLNRFAENILFFKERSNQLKGSVNAILILTLLGWVFAALQWFYLGNALGIKLSFFVFFLLHPLLSILMFVPISPAGLGLLEGGAILVFSLFSVSPELAMAFTVLVRVSILLVDLLGLKTVLASEWAGIK